MPYENKRVKDGSHSSRSVAHDSFFTEPDKQAATPAPFFTKKDTDKEDAPVQGQFIQSKAKAAGPGAKTHSITPPRANDTGLPDDLKSGMEDLSGFSLDDVHVHYNSDRPAQLQAHAYTQGKDIHVGPGQEKHLPHEAWHVVQQQQGRVNATMQMKGVGINNDEGLEKEADVMGKRAMQRGAVAGGGDEGPRRNVPLTSAGAPVQRLTGFEVETNIPVYHETKEGNEFINPAYRDGFTSEIGSFLFGGLKYGVQYGFDPEGHFSLTADHNELKRPHNNLVQLLLLSGFLKPEMKKRSMANLEYVTPARDELSTGSRQLFTEDIEHVRKHVGNTLDLAKAEGQRAVPDTGDWMLTGVPKNAILKWISLHKAHTPLFESVLNEMEGLITNKLYVQQTTGVLPEDIPGLYQGAADRMRDNKQKISKTMVDFMEAGIRIGQQVYLSFGTGILSKPFEDHKGAAVGYLTYLASYLLADSLSLTNFTGKGSTSKNLFPYFPKVYLSTAFRALPQDLRSEKEVWKKLVDKLCEVAGDYGLEYWKSKGLNISREAISSLIFGEDNPYYEFQQVSEELPPALERTKTKSKFNMLVEGEKVTSGGAKLKKLDEPHNQVITVTGQRAIPVEDRFWKEKFREDVTLSTFGKFMQDEADNAIARQLKHVPEDKEDEIKGEVYGKPDYVGMQQQRLQEKLEELQAVPANITNEANNQETNIGKYEKAILESTQQAKEITEIKIPRTGTNISRLEKLEAIKKYHEDKLKNLQIEKEKLTNMQTGGKNTFGEELSGKLQQTETAIKEAEKEITEAAAEEQLIWSSLAKDLIMTPGNLKLAKRKFQMLTNLPGELMANARKFSEEKEKAMKILPELRKMAEIAATYTPGNDFTIKGLQNIEEGKDKEKELNRRIYEQSKQENTWANKLRDDPAYSFDNARDDLEKDLDIERFMRVRPRIDVSRIKEGGVKDEVSKALTAAAELEPTLLKYKRLKIETASPEISRFLFEYMEAAKKYVQMMTEVFRTYSVATRKEEVKE